MNAPFTFKKDTRFDVVGFGTNAVDYLVRVPAYPEFNSKLELISYDIEPGGEVASTLVGLQRLGMRTAYAGRFGSDSAGSIGLRSLRDEGVEVTRAETIDGASTQVAFIVVDEASGERTIMWKRDARLRYEVSDAPLDLVRDAKLLHMTPHDTAAAIAMAKAARSAGVIVSLDIDNVFDGVEELMTLTDIAVCSSGLLEDLTGMRDRLSAMTEASARFGCRIVGITLGDHGSYTLCDGVFLDTPAFSVPGGCVDTTGAGDAYRCGLLYGLLQSWTVQEAARAANAVAALKCRGVGARSRLPRHNELWTLVKTV